METFSALLAICAGNSPVTGEFPAHKGQWRGALLFSLIGAWINGWVNNRKAGDLRRHHAHYNVIVMAHNVTTAVQGQKLCATSQGRHHESDKLSNHRRVDCLFNSLFRRRAKKTWKIRVTGLCEGNPPVAGEFPSQRTSNAENGNMPP